MDARSDPIDPGGACTLVAPDPAPRHDEERRVIDEVEQVIEATARIGRRPVVQLRLHREYPRLGLDRGRATARRCSPATSSRQRRCCEHAGPLRHVAGFPGLGLLRVLRPIPAASAGDGPSRRPAGCWPGRGPPGWFPRSLLEPFDGVGAQLCPCNIATATPQAFTVASRPATSPSPGVPRTQRAGARCDPAQIRQVRAGGLLLRSVQPLVPHVHLSVLLAGPGPSGSAGPSRRCQGCFHPPLRPDGSGCPQLHRPAATGRRRCPFTTARFESASWRSMSQPHT